jgi:hypothetical protein
MSRILEALTCHVALQKKKTGRGSGFDRIFRTTYVRNKVNQSAICPLYRVTRQRLRMLLHRGREAFFGGQSITPKVQKTRKRIIEMAGPHRHSFHSAFK